MDIALGCTLLGGLSPQQFMRTHWQKKPLLVRQAVPALQAPVDRAELFALAARDDVESRLVIRDGRRWELRQGPFRRRSLPPLAQPGWTLLVQGLDLHLQRARELLDAFRFVPEARLDDLMLSYASDRGGVGPHIDSYDVFLLQAAGRRHWRIGRVARPRLVAGLPLRILAEFEAEEEWVLEPGDMLYLPPGWGHEGTAVGACMTCSIGFRAPRADGIAEELLLRMADDIDGQGAGAMYRDPPQSATATPGRIPEALQAFATRAVERRLQDRAALTRALGEVLTEPKPQVWFEPRAAVRGGGALCLSRGSRMMYDATHVYLNGTAYRASGTDARLMQRLADRRGLDAAEVRRLSADARRLVDEWVAAGWLLCE